MKIITDREELRKTLKYFAMAAKEAKKSTCKKSQRGVIIVKNRRVIGKGHNKVTYSQFCHPCIREGIHNNSRVEMCAAIHAEQMAIIDACNHGRPVKGATMYHVKVKDGVIKPSKGGPSCTVCSRMIFEAGIKFVMKEERGIICYEPEEFNCLSFEYFKK